MTDDEDLRREVRRLREEVDALQRRLAALEESDGSDADHPSTGKTARPNADAATNSNVGSERTNQSVTERSERVDEAPVDGPHWELAIGVRWLGLAGALAVVVGVVFFVRLAIELGLLGPLGRVTAGTIGGLLLFGGGRYAAERQGSVGWGRIAAGTGLAVAYFSLYAAYGFEYYRETIGTPLWAVLAVLSLLVAVTAAVSIRDGAPLVVGEAFLLGYVTAYLSTEATTLVVTPAYVLLLAGGLVGIATVKPWSRLVVSSTVATYGIVGLWVADLDPPASVLGTVTVLAFFTYVLGGYILRGSSRVDERRYRVQLALLTAVNSIFAALLLELTLRDAFTEGGVDGIGAIIVAVLLGGVYAVTDRHPVRRDDVAAVGAVVLLAAGLAMALGTFATTVGALGVVCGAVALSRVATAPAFRLGAHVVAAALTLKLLAVDASRLPAFDAAEPMATLTGRPVAFALSIGVFYALAWWMTVEESALPDDEYVSDFPVNGAYATAATGLAVVALALELSGLGVSIAWGLFGFVLLGIGLYIDVRGVRLLAIVVLGLATAKVFLFDTRDLDAVARTLSFLGLGAILLAASYVYARSRTDVELPINLPKREERE